MRALLVVMLLSASAGTQDRQVSHSPFLEQARTVAATHGKALITLARQALTRAVSHGDLEPRLASLKGGQTPAPFGLFVTLVKQGHVRGCWGTMEPHGPTLEELATEAAIGAARFDHRSKPLSQHELGQVQVIVSLVGPMVPVLTIDEVDPKTHGLLVRSGERASVLLPGEAKTASWQLRRSLRQAGIKRKDPREMFRFRTVTIYETQLGTAPTP